MVIEPAALDHIVLACPHRGKAEQFFRDALGGRVSRRAPDATTLSVGNYAITLKDGGPPTGPLPHGHLAFRVSDLEAWCRRLRAHGVPVEGPETKGDGTHRILVRGPDDLLVELLTPPPLQHRDPADLINLF